MYKTAEKLDPKEKKDGKIQGIINNIYASKGEMRGLTKSLFLPTILYKCVLMQAQVRNYYKC